MHVCTYVHTYMDSRGYIYIYICDIIWPTICYLGLSLNGKCTDTWPCQQWRDSIFGSLCSEIPVNIWDPGDHRFCSLFSTTPPCCWYKAMVIHTHCWQGSGKPNIWLAASERWSFEALKIVREHLGHLWSPGRRQAEHSLRRRCLFPEHRPSARRMCMDVHGRGRCLDHRSDGSLPLGCCEGHADETIGSSEDGACFLWDLSTDKTIHSMPC